MQRVPLAPDARRVVAAPAAAARRAGSRRAARRPRRPLAPRGRGRRAADAAARRRRRAPRGEGGEEPVRRRRCRAHCSIAAVDLAAGRDVPAVGREAQRRDVAVDGAGHGARAACATIAQSSAVAVGMRSKTSRITCSGEAMMFRSASSAPAARSCLGAASSTSRSAATVIRSVPSTGSAASRAASVRRRSVGHAAAHQSGREVGQPVVVPGDARVGGLDRVERDGRRPGSGRRRRPRRWGCAGRSCVSTLGPERDPIRASKVS